MPTARSGRYTADSTPSLALLRGLQDRKWPLTCGAKGTRTPGLLDANQIFWVFLRRWTWPDGPFTCGDCRRLSVGVAPSLAPLALCLALWGRPSGSAAELMALGFDTHNIAAGGGHRFFPRAAGRKPQFRAQFWLLWLLPSSLLRLSGWRLQKPLEDRRPARRRACLAPCCRIAPLMEIE